MAIRHLPKGAKKVKRFEPTPEQREMVEQMASVGVTQEMIADCVGVCIPTLRKHFAQELALASTKANVRIARRLYEKAMSGDTVAMIFWLKTRMGWSEKNIHEFHLKDVQVSDQIMTPDEWQAQFAPKHDGPDGKAIN